MKTAKACSKIILFGEHAVVYGKPGIAAPVKKFYTLATVSSDPFSYTTDKELSEEETIKMNKMFRLLFDKLNMNDKNLSADIESNIPLGSGMGSSASLSVALIRGFSNYLDLKLTNEKINEIAFECEKIFHGTPSGIDNTVITFEQPIFYQKGKMEFIEFRKPINLIIANTGLKSETKEVVNEVREKYEKDKEKYSKIFDEIEKITNDARLCLQKGDIRRLGNLMTENHELLGSIGVSNIQLDALVEKALKAGAYGAKLIGAGKGGNMIALVENSKKEKVLEILKPHAKEVFSAVIS